MHMRWRNSEGLHLYPASQIARVLSSAKSTVHFTCRKATIDAKSMIELMTLAVEAGQRIKVIVVGEDADEVSFRLARTLSASVSWG